VRAPDGQKMSKSKGNTVDPLGLIDQYGADALRFFMAAMESQGRDIKMDEARLTGYRNFATKLWNAARFCQANGIGASESTYPPDAHLLPVNRWIIGKTIETIKLVDQALDELRFDRAAQSIYDFTWKVFCDWYLELIKPYLQREDLGELDEEDDGSALSPESAAHETRNIASWVLDQILVLLHPFMPFVTEELWHRMGNRERDLIVSKWPETGDEFIDKEAVAGADWAISLISEIRSSRSELNVPASDVPTMWVLEESGWVRGNLYLFQEPIKRMSRVRMNLSPNFDERSAGGILIEREGFRAIIPLGEYIDLNAEKSRLAKSLEAAEKEAISLDKRLSNPQFVEKAKPEAVEKARADHAEKSAEAERLRAAFERLG
jgi:valyl-tRNA synthetase